MYEQNNIYNNIIRPDVFTYTSVINAFSKRGDYDEAMKIFKIQMNDYKNKHNLSAKVRLRDRCRTKALFIPLSRSSSKRTF